MRVWIISWPLIVVGGMIGMVVIVLLAVVVLAGLLVWALVLFVRGIVWCARRSPRVAGRR